jgi:hypothetical protein
VPLPKLRAAPSYHCIRVLKYRQPADDGHVARDECNAVQTVLH